VAGTASTEAGTTTTGGATDTSTGTTLIAGGATTSTTDGSATSVTEAVTVAGVTDADGGGFIQVAGLRELPYTGVNMWFLIFGILLIITGILAIIVPKYNKKTKKFSSRF